LSSCLSIGIHCLPIENILSLLSLHRNTLSPHRKYIVSSVSP
jgi:hypothetical protein